MSSYLVQAGTALYSVSRAGVATSITLPTGITLSGAGTPCRAVLFMVGDTPIIVVVNGGTHDFWIDQTGTARQLQVSSPIAAPVTSAGTGTGSGLTGAYATAITFKVKDANGTTIMETGLGPISTGASITGTTIKVDSIPVSPDLIVNARGIYRTLSGGSTLYPWFDIDNNSTLTEDRGVTDANLSVLSTDAVTFGTAPDLKLITAWKNILWGVPRLQPDHVRWTEPNVFYSWSASNELIAPPQASDATGVTAFIPRRDQLGVARIDRLYQITGDSDDTFARNQVSPNIGCLSQESVVIIRDVAYWLGELGVVEWTAESIGYISEAQVLPWFTSDDPTEGGGVFNRTQFSNAQARYNPDTDAYELLLASYGQTTLDTWIAFDIKDRAWYGPHKTKLPLQCCGSDSERHGYLRDTSNFPIAVFGTQDGRLEKRDQSVTDDDAQSVALDVVTAVIGGFAPELEKAFLDPTLHTRVEAKSPTGPNLLTVTSSVGPIGPNGQITSSGDVVSQADLTTGFQRLFRPGTGQYLSLRFQHDARGERVRIYGVEVPAVDVGKRGR